MADQWTPERRAKQAQAIRAWKPWQKATGPRTIEGKATASRNAHKGAIRPMLRAISTALRKQLVARSAVVAATVKP